MVITFSVFRCSHRRDGRARARRFLFFFGYDGNPIHGDRVGADRIRPGEMFPRAYDDGYILSFSM